MLANEGNKSRTEDLSSAFKLIPLCLGSTFLVFIFFTYEERSIMLPIYCSYLLEKCDRLLRRLNKDNVEITTTTTPRAQYNVMKKKYLECVVSRTVAFLPIDMSMF